MDTHGEGRVVCVKETTRGRAEPICVCMESQREARRGTLYACVHAYVSVCVRVLEMADGFVMSLFVCQPSPFYSTVRVV